MFNSLVFSAESDFDKAMKVCERNSRFGYYKYQKNDYGSDVVLWQNKDLSGRFKSIGECRDEQNKYLGGRMDECKGFIIGPKVTAIVFTAKAKLSFHEDEPPSEFFFESEEKCRVALRTGGRFKLDKSLYDIGNGKSKMKFLGKCSPKKIVICKEFDDFPVVWTDLN
jgi:hypothetical protein